LNETAIGVFASAAAAAHEKVKVVQEFVALRRVDSGEPNPDLQHRQRQQTQPSFVSPCDSNPDFAASVTDPNQVAVDLVPSTPHGPGQPRQELVARATHFAVQGRFLAHGRPATRLALEA
jgi:hypothetical protein